MRIWVLVTVITAGVFLFSSCGVLGANLDAASLEVSEEPGVSPPLTDHELLVYFAEAYPDKEIVLLFEGDCNADEITDLVIIYKEHDEANHQVTVYSHLGGYRLSDPIPAPFEDITLEWKDIDRTPPTELVVSGRRGINMGLGVLRFVDGEWIDLFGGLDECC